MPDVRAWRTHDVVLKVGLLPRHAGNRFSTLKDANPCSPPID